MDLIITIDTEADNQWARPKSLTLENKRFLPRFQSLCDRFAFRPTYLCTYEMVVDPEFQDIVGPYQESGRAEIGAHLHPWTSPPFGPEEPQGTDHHTFPSELSLETFELKMAHLGAAIKSAFGRAPTSYRAGRYGFCESQTDVLSRLGYRVDCSVAPFMTYSHVAGMPGGRGGADFRKARPEPYLLPGGSGRDGGRVVEVPITILFAREPIASWPACQGWLADHPSHLVTRLLRRSGFFPEWFRPGRDVAGSDLIRIYNSAKRRGLPCAEMMFHSSELMPGCSPTFPDESSIERLYTTFEEVFRHIAQDEGRGATLTGFAEAYVKLIAVAQRERAGGDPAISM